MQKVGLGQIRNLRGSAVERCAVIDGNSVCAHEAGAMYLLRTFGSHPPSGCVQHTKEA